MSAVSRPLSILCVLTAIGVACGQDPPGTVLQAIDTKAPTGDDIPFDRNNIVDPAAFTDFESIDSKTVQRFFGKTPYDHPSFLETYQSNGFRASDAVVTAARQYHINPLVFIVYAQTTQGLVGERNYPFPPDRIEYVFRCGCTSTTSCLPAFAGFDRQVDCLGQALREYLDEIRANEQTITGWGPNKTSLTLDNQKITPLNDATAALYARSPNLSEGKPGGAWVFWNVWNLYAPKLDYIGPTGAIDGGWIGDPCVSDGACGYDSAICALNYPDGLCTSECTGECPSDPSRPPSFCAKFRDGGFCFPVCNPTTPECREGYRCLPVSGLTDGITEHVCTPQDPAAK